MMASPSGDTRYRKQFGNTIESAFVADDGDYKPKNILITGGAGFIASHVVILMVKKYPNLKIVNFDRLDYCSCIENLNDLKSEPNYKFIKGNICSSELVSYVLESEKIDTIMHFAAQTHVDNSFGNSFQFTQNNILGTHVLLESAKVANIARFIHVSTDEVYGEQRLDQEAMNEEQVLEPTNPYAATKAGAEFIAKSYHRSFGMPLIITRGNNVYGPHQYPEKLIPKFINQLTRGRQVTLHGNNKTNLMYHSNKIPPTPPLSYTLFHLFFLSPHRLLFLSLLTLTDGLHSMLMD